MRRHFILEHPTWCQLFMQKKFAHQNSERDGNSVLFALDYGRGSTIRIHCAWG